jgi:phosphoribosylamine-glycine ligase
MATAGKINILIIGDGAPEHSLAWRLTSCERADKIFVLPGNEGTALLPRTVNVEHVDPSDFPAVMQFALVKRVGLVVPLSDVAVKGGMADFFQNCECDLSPDVTTGQ